MLRLYPGFSGLTPGSRSGYVKEVLTTLFLMAIKGKASTDNGSLPTLLQYCKSSLEHETKKNFTIVKVWLPNQFPNVTLETEDFRIRINEKADTYSEVLEFIDSCKEEGKVMLVRITDSKNGSYEIDSYESEVGEWEELGTYGLKVTVKDKPKSRRKSR